MCALAAVSLAAFMLAKTTTAGSNGLAQTPPMGWRSWNQFGWYVSEDIMLSAAEGLTDTSRPIKGRPVGSSLKDLGYNSVGLDEGWAACPPQKGPFPHGRDPRVDPRVNRPRQNVTAPFSIGHGKKSMYHRANPDGSISPVVDQLLFPDMKGMVKRIHAKGLRAGWYLNDCLSYCMTLGDQCSSELCIPGDVKAFLDYEFDDLKLDSCSAQRDIEMWADLLNKSGRQLIIENCNNGPKPSTPVAHGGCPHYHFYRTGPDINNGYASWIKNALTVEPLAAKGLTGPGCWAYPDMLQIGVQGQTPDEDWQIGKNPWDGFQIPTLTQQRTHFGLWCILSSPLVLSIDFRNTSAVAPVWDIITNLHAIAVNQAWAGEAGGIFASASTQVMLSSKGTSVRVPAWQAWYKPLPNNNAAVLLANHDTKPLNITLDLSKVPGFERARTFELTDVWEQVSMAGTHSNYSVVGLASHDSLFITARPSKAEYIV